MSLKHSVIRYLEKSKAEFISGEGLAKELNVSRAAIWKAMQSLVKEGYKIEAIPNKGYKLMHNNDVISLEGIELYLSKKYKLEFEYLKEVDSTNNLMKDRAKEGKGEGYVIAASSQSKGRGRLGRTFYSPEGSGIYMSILLRPDLNAEDAGMLTAAAAVAVSSAIDKLSQKESKIKWVNDIYIDDKKVCGILTEASFNMENGKLEYVIVGIGVNVYQPDGGFPMDIKDIASEVFKSQAGDMRNKLIAKICDEFFAIYSNFSSKGFVKDYKAIYLLYGMDILVISPKGTKNAKALYIDDNCHLMVQYENGEIQALSSGEVSIKQLRS